MQTWFGLPLVVRIAIIIAAWAWYAVLILVLNTEESASRIGMFVGLACSVAAGVTVIADLRVHRRFGSIEKFIAYRRALRTGELPAGIELDEWLRWLHGTRLSIGTRALWAGPLVLFGWMSSLTSQSPYRWVPAAAFTLLGVWGFVALCMTGARTKRLEAELKRRRVALSRAAGTPPETAATNRQREGFNSSLAERLLGGSLVWFICAFLVLLIADLESLVHGGPRMVPLEGAVGCAALVVVAWAVLGEVRDLRRDFASFEQYAQYNRTVQTGEMPADIEPDAWRGRLRSSRRENLLRVLLACFLVVVGVSSILTDQSAYRWVSASLFELVAIWLLVEWWTTRERLASLAAEVERHAIRQTLG